MEKSEAMKLIVAKVGREKAIDLVMQAYNTELLNTGLSRMDSSKAGIGGYKRRDHLADALERVIEVCNLVS